MGRASRIKHERRTGRTITVRNDLSGQLETFHDVRVSDAAVADWLADRWMSVGAGHPNRPPDHDTPTSRWWEPRPGDPPMDGEPLARADELVAFYCAQPTTVGLIFDGRTVIGDAGDCLIPLRPHGVMASAKGAIVRAQGMYTGRARLQLEFVGTVRHEEASFATEAEARAWVIATLGDLSRGQPVEELDPGLDALRRAA